LHEDYFVIITGLVGNNSF